MELRVNWHLLDIHSELNFSLVIASSCEKDFDAFRNKLKKLC
jgi:hypothetical protein